VKIERDRADYQELRTKHWSWQPLGRPLVPQVKLADWPLDDVDRFLLARLEAENLAPVADADKASLLRRVTFDLTGLPPTPSELEEFLADPEVQDDRDQRQWPGRERDSRTSERGRDFRLTDIRGHVVRAAC